jgi:AcrR family transcriptional regulator
MDEAGTGRQSRSERKKEINRQRVVKTAMRLFMENGVNATTMEQIAEEADIAKGTLYHYFPVKEAIISEYMQQSFREKNGQRIQRFKELEDTRSRVRALLEELLEGIGENREIFEKYMVYRMQRMVSFEPEEGIKSGLYRLTREIVELGVSGNELKSDVPLSALEDMLEFAFIEAAKLLLAGAANDIGKAIDLCTGLFLNGAGKI